MIRGSKRRVIGDSKIVDVSIPVPVIVFDNRSDHCFENLIGPLSRVHLWMIRNPNFNASSFTNLLLYLVVRNKYNIVEVRKNVPTFDVMTLSKKL